MQTTYVKVPSLENITLHSHLLHPLGLDALVQPVDGDVLLARALLRLDQPRRTLHAHDQAASHLRVKRARVARLLHAQDALDPGEVES